MIPCSWSCVVYDMRMRGAPRAKFPPQPLHLGHVGADGFGGSTRSTAESQRTPLQERMETPVRPQWSPCVHSKQMTGVHFQQEAAAEGGGPAALPNFF